MQTVKADKIDQKDAYKNEYDTLTYWGINLNKKYSLFHYVRCFIVISSALILTCTIMIKMSMESRLEKIIGSLYFSVTEVTYIWKLFNFIYHRKNFTDLDLYLSKDVFNRYDKAQEIYIKNAVTSANRLSTIFRTLIILCIIMYSLYPFIDNRLLPIDGWFPIDMEKYRIPLIIFQVSSIALSSLINSSIDIITFGLISVSVAHYSIIRDTLINIKEGLEINDVRNVIGQCCYYHNSVISVTKQIENTFSYGILIQFLASIVVICMTGFEMIIVPPKSAEFGLLFSYFLLVMCQITLYCFFGHQLMIKSQEIQDACYMSEWYAYDPSVGKMLFIIMERSKRPILLTAGQFFYLNIPTLVSILRSSYSYFAVLRRLYVNE